jgi:hypothetical protein
LTCGLAVRFGIVTLVAERGTRIDIGMSEVFRHGLSLPLRLDTATSAKIDAIAQVVTRNQADEEQLSAATELAEAQLQLLRIRGVRAELMATFDITCGDYQKLQKLAALDN